MVTDQGVVLDAIKEGIADLPERCPKYHSEALASLADILIKERENKTRPIAIVQYVRSKVEALAGFVEASGVDL